MRLHRLASAGFVSHRRLFRASTAGVDTFLHVAGPLATSGVLVAYICIFGAQMPRYDEPSSMKCAVVLHISTHDIITAHLKAMPQP